MHLQTSYGGAPAARARLRQEAGGPLTPAERHGDGSIVSHKGVDDTAYTTDNNATTGLNTNTNTKIREHSAMPSTLALAEAEAERGAGGDVTAPTFAETGGQPRVAGAAGSVNKDDGGGTPIKRELELLYAIDFYVAPPREGDNPMQLSAEVSPCFSCRREAPRFPRVVCRSAV